MTWYKIILEQKQPIHIGYKRYGVLAETRIFIPGQTMWGALTKAYNLMKGNSLNTNQELFEQITCFYPSFDKENILKPNFKNGEFHLGYLSEKEFRLLFVDSFTSTAILPETRTAKDESLHEIEFVLPKPKKSLKNTKLWEKITKLGYNNENLKWIGLINIDEKLKDELKNLKIFIGGDSRYGFGLMEIYIKEIKKKEKELEKWNLNSDRTLNLKEKTLLNSLEFDNNIKFEGKFEILPTFNFVNMKIENAKYVIGVGGKIIKGIDGDKYRLIKGVFYIKG
ncbi:protein of unknown function DUF324 [Methanocaldococcus vulcanius M7]|uniref:CRISPR type III-associated protein domain-containing protein n=1 Tax=Methanocaldococcus vulcanius (strain ATCC 700851 / DSM 12094 / M7) TaxID=579137 RepID=C9RHU9_METVM|nr:RAMP superfamily CRISPR-associated protein [Methanocaldococcus vulcanius]ACX73151.1 protein of unknown function DUF324 [Methanocaldococcus vulcanius M7]